MNRISHATTHAAIIEQGLYTVFNERGESEYTFELVQWENDGSARSKVHLTHVGLVERLAARGKLNGYAVYLDFSQGKTMCGVTIPHEREVDPTTVQSGVCRTCERLART